MLSTNSVDTIKEVLEDPQNTWGIAYTLNLQRIKYQSSMDYGNLGFQNTIITNKTYFSVLEITHQVHLL